MVCVFSLDFGRCVSVLLTLQPLSVAALVSDAGFRVWISRRVAATRSPAAAADVLQSGVCLVF